MENRKRCDNCIFSCWTISPNRPALICMQKASRVGKWHVVLLDQSCRNFYPGTNFKFSLPFPRRIPLTKGKFAIVDADDYYRLTKYKWHAARGVNTSYAAANWRGKGVIMHRVIMGAPDHLVVDHIDHNGLNNTKANLRLCTTSQNNRNCVPKKGTTSRYKGVVWNKERKKWRAAITFNKKAQLLGDFENEIDAAKAYDRKAAELFGEFACLNFPT